MANELGWVNQLQRFGEVEEGTQWTINVDLLRMLRKWIKASKELTLDFA